MKKRAKLFLDILGYLAIFATLYSVYTGYKKDIQIDTISVTNKELNSKIDLLENLLNKSVNEREEILIGINNLIEGNSDIKSKLKEFEMVKRKALEEDRRTFQKLINKKEYGGYPLNPNIQ